jgi:hypothetical protein
MELESGSSPSHGADEGAGSQPRDIETSLLATQILSEECEHTTLCGFAIKSPQPRAFGFGTVTRSCLTSKRL